jgi:hydroxyacylglutathione hydrolase
MGKYGRVILFIMMICSLISFQSTGVWGAAIQDSESKTHGLDASRYHVVDTYRFPGFEVVQMELPVLSIYSYLLISEGKGLVVDPCRDISFILALAKKKGVKIIGVYLSHSHADFVAGHMELVNRVKCPIYQSHKSGAQYPFEPVKEGSEIRVGKALVKFMETPGHTPDGMCALVYGPENHDVPELMFTGDVLFVGSVGRPDLMGKSVSAAWLASAFFDSWQNKISKLDDKVKIFPAHGAGSLCGAHLADRPFSTLGEEKKTNPYLKYKNRGEFIAALIQDLPEAPQYFKHNAALNTQGPPLVDWEAGLPPAATPNTDLENPEKTYVVDLRNADAYAAGHIPNSVNIALRGRLETWVGTMVPWGTRVVLVGSKKQLKEGLLRLHRIGYAPEIITFEAWRKAGMPVTVSQPIAPSALYDMMQNGEAPLIVDVRLPTEWMALKIGTVLNLPLNHLSDLSRKLDPKAPVVVVCNSAYRSSMAVGVLERKGFETVRNLEGGSQAWIDGGFPVFEGTNSGGKVTKAVPKGKTSPGDLKRPARKKSRRPPEMDAGC